MADENQFYLSADGDQFWICVCVCVCVYMCFRTCTHSPVLWCRGVCVMSLCVVMALCDTVASEISWKVMLR